MNLTFQPYISWGTALYHTPVLLLKNFLCLILHILHASISHGSGNQLHLDITFELVILGEHRNHRNFTSYIEPNSYDIRYYTNHSYLDR